MSFPAATAFSNAQFGQGTGPIALKDVHCDASGNKLLECYSDPLLAVTGCSHAEDAGVQCEGLFHCPPRMFIFRKNAFDELSHLVSLAPCGTGEARLVGGIVPYEGRAEICIDNEWGSICDVSWDEVDASVVCASLDYLSDGESVLILLPPHIPPIPCLS